jgi:hypothetical protein
LALPVTRDPNASTSYSGTCSARIFSTQCKCRGGQIKRHF